MDEYNVSTAPDQSIRKKLNKMFNRYNWIGIQNPLKKDFTWRVALEENEILDFKPGDPMNEEKMAQTAGGTFLPGDSTFRVQTKMVEVNLKSGEKRMISGEAAFVVAPKLFGMLVRERYGNDKAGLAKLRNPLMQDQLLKEIVVGPKIDNVGQAMQTFVNEKMGEIEGFTDIQTKPKGFSNPEVLAKAQATRNANKANG
jgi:hypothetical protein